MCKHTKSSNKRIDCCIAGFIQELHRRGIVTYGSCCGHKKYSLTVICKSESSGMFFDLISGVCIPRVKRFYRKDVNGLYYIPEVVA
jgi:hypothetical protein